MDADTQAAAKLLESSRTIAIVGFSANPDKAAHRAPMHLVRRGWNVIPVNPTIDEVEGLRAYPTLADVPVPIDLVDVFRPAEETAGIAREAVAAGASAIWLQLGISSEEARVVAAEGGLEYVEDLCAGALAERLDLTPAAG